MMGYNTSYTTIDIKAEYRYIAKSLLTTTTTFEIPSRKLGEMFQIGC
jgi:hypothetical protein